MTDRRGRERIDAQGWVFLGGGLLLVAAAAGYFLIAAVVQPAPHRAASASESPRAPR